MRWPRTSTGALSTATDELAKVAHLLPIRLLLRMQKCEKLLSAFGPKLWRLVNPETGRLHPHYNVAGTKAGRWSSSDPNVQQLPHDEDTRRIIVAPPGCVERIRVGGTEHAFPAPPILPFSFCFFFHMADTRTDEALRRYRIIRPFLADAVPLPAIARTSGVPLRTLTRWAEKYRRRGLAGLQRRSRVDKDRLRSLPAEKQALVEALAPEKPRRSVAAICRMLGALGANGTEKAPGYTPASWMPSIRPCSRSPMRAARPIANGTILLYRRQATAPNALWQADHTELDIMVLDETGKPARPWLSVIIDDYSRAVAGYCVSLQAPAACARPEK